MSLSPFDHPFLSGLLGEAETAALFRAGADLAAMLAFEAELAEAAAALGLIPAGAGPAIAALARGFRPDMAALAAATARDGVVVPELVTQLRAALGEPFARHVHHGATSQDVIDTSLVLRLKQAAVRLDRRLAVVIGQLERLAARDGGHGVTAHTRMQPAGTLAAAAKLAQWRAPLERHRQRLAELGPRVFVIQLGGAIGDRAAWGEAAQGLVDRVAASLGLGSLDRTRHTERDGIAELASWLSLVSGSLGKIGQDIVLMAQAERAEITLAEGGRSSAIPGKANPVAAEILVTLARFNATQLAGIHAALVHENERSGAAWTLEWMILPQMVLASAAGLRTAETVLAGLRFLR